MAVVFVGTHEWTGRAVAIKVLNHDLALQPAIVQRFLHEARAAAQLKHRNIVDVLDGGNEPDGTVYLVLELLEGRTLKELLAVRGKLSPRETVSMLVPVMDAIGKVHARKIVHRDLKPDNIFLATDEDGATVPKVLDFGIAKVSATGSVTATATGAILGTPAYMAPEQARGVADVDARADVWSMGVMLFECLTGTLPFRATTPADMILAILTQAPLSLRTLAPEVPESLAAVVDRALDRDRDRRYPTMAELARAFEHAAREPDTVTTAIPAAPLPESTIPGTRIAPQLAPELAPESTAPALRVAPAAPEAVTQTPFGWTTEPPDRRPPRRRGLLWVAIPLTLLGMIGAAGAVSLWNRPDISTVPLVVPEVPVVAPSRTAAAPTWEASPPVAPASNAHADDAGVAATSTSGSAVRATPATAEPASPRRRIHSRHRTDDGPRRGANDALILR